MDVRQDQQRGVQERVRDDAGGVRAQRDGAVRGARQGRGAPRRHGRRGPVLVRPAHHRDGHPAVSAFSPAPLSLQPTRGRTLHPAFVGEVV